MLRPLAPSRSSLRELLIDQLHMLDLDEKYMILGENIIGSLDKDGYFKQDLNKIVNELVLFEHLELKEEDGERMLQVIQSLEPAGIGARG